MGWDIERFPEGEVNLELICCICTCILEDPVESPCRHVFCSACIKTWLSNQKSCPHCRAPVHKRDLQSVVPLLKNIIGKQKIFCDNREGGCPEIISLEALAGHIAICPFGMVSCVNEGCVDKICRKDLKLHIEICSKRTVLCERGCEMLLKLGDRTKHNCVQALRSHIQETTNEMQDRISKLEELVNVLVSKSCSYHGDLLPSSNCMEEQDNYGHIPYSIPSPRTYDSGHPPYTVFADNGRINNVNLTGISAENNDFSDSVESVESENIEQRSEVGTRYNTSVNRASELDNPPSRQRNHTLPEREISPSFRHLNRVSDTLESRGRNERLWENGREQIRSRSAHNRRQMAETTYSRNRSNSNHSRESRIERVNRSYPNYDRESRVNHRESRVSNTSDTGEQDEPLILRIGVSSQTVTDSSTSSGSSSDSENEA